MSMSMKPYPEYKDSGVEWLGRVPAEWVSTKLGRHIVINSGLVDPKSEPFSDMIMVAPNHIESWTGKIRYTETATQQGAESGKYQVYKGQIIYSKIRPNLMKVAIAPFDCLCSADMYGVDADGDMLSNPFLTYYLLSHEFHDYAVDQSARVAMPKLNHETLKATPIFLPPIQDQWAIARYLDRETSEIDAFIADQEELIVLLAERRTATITQAVTKGLDPDAPIKDSQVEWIGNIPKNWNAAPLRMFAEMRTGHTPSRSKPEYWIDCYIPWFTLADVWQLRNGGRYLGDTKQSISEMGLANSAADLLPAGTVVLSRTASVGFTGIMPRPMTTSQDYWNWICGPKLASEFLWYQLVAMKPFFGSLVQGSTHKTIYQGDAAALRIVLPSLEEQRAIVAYLDRETAEIDAAITDARESIKLSKERRVAVISAAVTGKIDVRGLAVPITKIVEAETLGVA